MFPQNTLMQVMVIQVVEWSLTSIPTCLLLWTAFEALFHWQDPQACFRYTHKQTHAWTHTQMHTLIETNVHTH